MNWRFRRRKLLAEIQAATESQPGNGETDQGTISGGQGYAGGTGGGGASATALQ